MSYWENSAAPLECRCGEKFTVAGIVDGENEDWTRQQWQCPECGSWEDWPATREQRARRALALLREARDIYDAIGAKRTLERLRDVLPSADGAVRAASHRDRREADKSAEAPQ